MKELPSERRRAPRVLMTADTLGGVWTYAVELARALAEAGLDVLIVARGRRPSAAQRAQLESFDRIDLTFVGGKLEWMQNPWDDVKQAGERILRIARSWEPDVVHLNEYSLATLPWGCPTVVVGHSCVYSWFQQTKGTLPPHAEFAGYFRRVRDGLCSADVVVTPTRAMMNALSIYGSFQADKVVIANGYGPLPSPDTDTKRAGALCAGRLWDEAKNIRLFADSADFIEGPCSIAGERANPCGNSSEAQPRNLKCLGHLDTAALHDYMRHTAVYVHPARYEPFGLCPLEAAQCGCALVLSDIPSLREVWGGNALYVPTEARGHLAGTVNLLLHSEKLRDEFARRARNRALQLTRSIFGETYLALYNALVAEPKNVRTAVA